MEPRHKVTGGEELPPIPAKRYFTIGEVSELCGVKPHVLRYWEQEFNQLKPVKRRGTRRYYQHHDVLLIRRIRELLYSQGFTISGARNQLDEGAGNEPVATPQESHRASVDMPGTGNTASGLRAELAYVIEILRL
ncbi:MAG: MerR family transcriptional regulator [Azonexus sp.]